MRSPDRRTPPRTPRYCIALLASALVLSGCGSPESDGGQRIASTGMVPAVSPATSINAVMVGMVDHAAHHLWDLGRDGMAPDTDQEWDEVIHHSIQLIVSGTAVTTGGTGVFDEEWVQEPAWQRFAQDMTDAGALALTAANQRDLGGVLQAGDALIETCEGCHTEYKPELPTEGMVHPHY